MDVSNIVGVRNRHNVVDNKIMKKLYLNMFVLAGLAGGLLLGWTSYEYYSRHKEDCFIELPGIKSTTFCMKIDGNGGRYYQSAEYRIYIR